MRWFVRLLIGIVVVYAVLTGYEIAKVMRKDQPMPTTHAAPANWKYAAAKKGRTFHAKGCPGMPKLPPGDMVYGNSTEEIRGKNPCPQCINNVTASVAKAPQTTPNKNITQSNN